MENKNFNKLLKYIKENDIVVKYQTIFDRFFSYETLYLISEEEIEEIISLDIYESVIKLFEVLNSVKIPDNIKKYILSIDDFEILKYCLRLSVCKNFDDENKKFEYIKALGESKSESVRYAYGVASSKLYINSDDGVKYVEEIGKCNSDIIIPIIDILHNRKCRNDDELFNFLELVKEVKEEYIAEYMSKLFKNEYDYENRVPLSYISVLLSSKGSNQAFYAYSILTNEKMLKRDDVSLIALIVAMSDDEEVYNKYNLFVNSDFLDNSATSVAIYNMIRDDLMSSHSKVKTKLI